MQPKLHSLRRILCFVALSLVIAGCGGTTNPTSTAGQTARTVTPTGSTTGAETKAPATTQAATPAATAQTTATTGPSGGNKVLHIHQQTYPDLLDPQKSATIQQITVLAMAYEGLTRLNDKLETVPAAAEKWEYSRDGTVITFTLRSGLKYSDGSPLTAKNFEYSLRRNLDPRTAGPYQAITFDVVGAMEVATVPPTDTAGLSRAFEDVGIRALDDRTLVLRLIRPAPYFHTIMSLWITYPAKQELIEKGGDSWWQDPKNHVGNGPFVFDQIKQDQLIALKANPNYWGGKPKIDGLDYLYIKDSSVALEAYRSGQLDIMKPDPSQLAAIRSDTRLNPELISYPLASTSYLAFNLRMEPFTDKKVREAFSYGFDRETFCEVIRNGDCTPTLSWVPPGVAGSYKEDRFGFDLEKAKQALSESKYGSADKLPPIKFTYNSDDPSEKTRVEWVASQYETNLGIKIQLEAVEGKTFVSMFTNPETFPQLLFLGWTQDYPDPQNWLSVFWACETAFAQTFQYCNKEFDNLVRQGDTEVDPAKRIQHYVAAGKVLAADVPGPFLYNLAGNFLVKPHVKNYTRTASDMGWPGQWASLTTIDIQR